MIAVVKQGDESADKQHLFNPGEQREVGERYKQRRRGDMAKTID